MDTKPTHIDVDKGEFVRLLALSDDQSEQHRKYVYPGGYLTMGLVNITRLVNCKLPADGYRLALLIAAKVAPVSSLCHTTNEAYAKELGITRNRVSRLIGRLCACKLVYRMNPRLVMVNPGWCFRGTPTQHAEALETWGKLHPIGVVSARRKTA